MFCNRRKDTRSLKEMMELLRVTRRELYQNEYVEDYIVYCLV